MLFNPWIKQPVGREGRGLKERPEEKILCCNECVIWKKPRRLIVLQ